MARKKIKFDTTQRPFSMIYHDFLKSVKNGLLDNHYQIIIYIYLKMFADSKNQCYPSVKTINKLTKISNTKIKETIAELKEKGAITKENRIRSDGGKSSNLYTLHDYTETWATENEKDMETIIHKYEEMQLISELQSRGYTVIKKREPEILPASQSNNNSSTQFNQFDTVDNTSNSKKSQELERYTMDEIHQLFNYDIMMIDYPDKQRDINSVMNILYTAMNTTKSTIRIAGEDKPTMVVISKLMKLDKDSIMYVIENFSKQTERIKNAVPYILTMLYNAPEQFNFDIQNLALHNMAHWNEKEKNIEN